MFYSLDKMKPKTKTKKQNIFCWCKWKFNNFFIHFELGGQENIFLEGEKNSCPPYSKCIKKSSNFHLHQQKIFWFLVFSFWFQFIQQIEQNSWN